LLGIDSKGHGEIEVGIERRRVVAVTRHDMGLQCFMERKD
jgi:hypothetical protein